MVLEQIRQIAVEGYHRVPHGGVETGGILFGTHQKNVVRIKAWRAIDCEYARGPSFLLSEKDEAALTESLKSWRGDAERARLEPVGWYRAHTRSEILLSDADLAFFDRFFPLPWQVALIVRPASFAPTRAGFFFREADGGIRAQSSYREFPLAPLAVAEPAAAESATVQPAAAQTDGAPAIPAAPVREAATVALPETKTAPVTEPRPEAQAAREPVPVPPRHAPRPEWDPPLYPPFRAPAARQNPRLKWYATGLTVLVVAVLGFWLLRPSHPALKLSATDIGGQLRINWDRASGSIAHAKGGSIEIEDHGVRTQVSLTPADLRTGSVFYERLSGDVIVRLTVDVAGRPPLAETTRFLRPGDSGLASEPRRDEARKPELPHQPDAQQSRLDPPPSVAPPTVAAPLSLPLPSPAAPVRRVVPFQAPDKAPVRPSTDIPAIAPPRIENLSAVPAGGLPPMLGSAPVPVAPSAASSRAATGAPASGKIIWTGKLAKNGKLVVERNHASSGALSGILPAVSARVSAYPGDLTATGITLFTPDPRYSQPLTEKAGADNGWNPTTYTWDPKRAAGIHVVEQPGPQNGYKVVLQSDTAKLSVVVLEWRATQ